MDEGDRRGVDRLTIQEAARALGISEGAVRKRVTRGTLQHEKEDDGRVYVYLDAGDRRGLDDGQDEGLDPNSNALISQLRDEVAYLRDENRRKDEIIMQQAMTTRQLAAAPPQEPSEAAEKVEEEPERAEPRPTTVESQEGTRRPQPASGVLGTAAILTLFLVGLLLVSGAAAFAAYMYEDPVFGSFVRVLPITPLVAGAFGGIAGYVAGRGMDFSRFLLGGGITGLVAMAVAHRASVMVKGQSPADWDRSVFAMGLVLVATWAMFTSGAYLGKLILLRSGKDRAELLRILAPIATVIATLFVGIIAVAAGD